jgi:hypothetical protein
MHAQHGLVEAVAAVAAEVRRTMTHMPTRSLGSSRSDEIRLDEKYRRILEVAENRQGLSCYVGTGPEPIFPLAKLS